MTNPNNKPTPIFDETVPQQFLEGPRQTGVVPIGETGAFVEHSISGDGMKFSRNIGEQYKSAADFYDKKATEAESYKLATGVYPFGYSPAEKASGLGNEISRSARILKVARGAGQALHSTLNKNHPSKHS